VQKAGKRWTEAYPRGVMFPTPSDPVVNMDMPGTDGNPRAEGGARPSADDGNTGGNSLDRRSEVDAFLRKVAALPPRPAMSARKRGRLMFALDATASRGPTWDRACHIQGDMFASAADLGGIEVQLVYYRGFRECRASPWVANAVDLSCRMTAVTCLGGQTQIGRVLAHAAKETRQCKVDALIFVGDACEEEPDHLCHLAGELGLLGVPAFIFHEGTDPAVRRVFTQMARLSGGAYCAFDAASAQQLRELLKAVAVYAAGGRTALEDWSRGKSPEVLRLTHQLAGS